MSEANGFSWQRLHSHMRVIMCSSMRGSVPITDQAAVDCIHWQSARRLAQIPLPFTRHTASREQIRMSSLVRALCKNYTNLSLRILQKIITFPISLFSEYRSISSSADSRLVFLSDNCIDNVSSIMSGSPSRPKPKIPDFSKRVSTFKQLDRLRKLPEEERMKVIEET